MKPQEIFDCFNPDDDYLIDTGRDIATKYWWLEYEIADEIGAPYSDIEGSSIEVRTCAICGTLTGTDGNGRISTVCYNVKCEGLRKFWHISGPIYKFWNVSGSKEKNSWFKNKIKKTFKTGQKLSDIPKELRFEFLLLTMAERIAYESTKNN